MSRRDGQPMTRPMIAAAIITIGIDTTAHRWIPAGPIWADDSSANP